jgi:hypothetical protein
MIATNLFNIPFFVSTFLPFVGAGALAFIAYTLIQGFTPRIGKSASVSRIENFVGDKRTGVTASAVPVGSFKHKVRVAFSSIKIDASDNEEFYLNAARGVVGAGMFVVLYIIGLPFFTSLIGFVGGYVFVDSWVRQAWNKVRLDIEGELPALLVRLSSAIQAAPNVLSALETVARTLRSDGPMRAWTMETAARMHSEGYGCIESIRESATGISTSLSIAADLIGRMWTTGGEGYANAFISAASNLESVLDARVLARAKGGGAQNTVNILTVLTFGMIAFISRSSAMANVVSMPIIQLAYAGICLAVVYGYSQVSELIDEAV